MYDKKKQDERLKKQHDEFWAAQHPFFGNRKEHKILAVLKFWGLLYLVENIIFSIFYTIHLYILVDKDSFGFAGFVLFIIFYRIMAWHFLFSWIFTTLYLLEFEKKINYFPTLYALLFAIHLILTTSMVSFNWDAGMALLILGMSSAFFAVKLTTWYLFER